MTAEYYTEAWVPTNQAEAGAPFFRYYWAYVSHCQFQLCSIQVIENLQA
jgi:hypothetical protein